MTSTFRAIQVTAPGRLELVHRPVPEPTSGEVLIAVEACGICGADASDIEGADPAARRVPGHEVVGRILARGAAVPSLWRIGQRVGIGRLGGPCLECRECRAGVFHLCRNQPVTGSSRDGGYAELMTARATGLVTIPDELDSVDAAPILCAGLATFNALKRCGAQAGDTVAILGIGGLGHMAVQYARRMGFRTIAIGRGEDICGPALELGAHRYVDSRTEDAAKVLTALGGARAVLATVGDAEAIAALLPGLQPQARLMLLGGGREPVAVPLGPMIGAERAIQGSITGSPYENERALDFSVLAGVRPMIETMPLEHAAEAYARMRSGAATFRMVLTMEGNPHADQ